ncbi:MAG TPA: oxidoreductase, partial [Actinobacteria bacterium]|nr:oxidoreductase [Actinomycetota bacterium]
TGPVVRGDAGTVAAHVDVINEVSVEARRAYVAMARLTADRALANGMLRATQAEALLDVLAAEPAESSDPPDSTQEGT